MSVKVAINIGGRERIVEFDSAPTDADIDEAYNALSGERVPSPDRQPSMVARQPQTQSSPQKKGWVDRAIEFQHPASNPINDILGIKPKPDPTSFIKPADQIRRDIVNQAPKQPKGKSGIPSKGGYNNLIGHTGAAPPKNLPPSPDRQPSMQPAQGSLDDYLSMTPQQLDALAKQNPEAANIIYQHQMAQRGNPFKPDFTNTPLPQGFSGFTGRDTGGFDPLAKAIAEAAKAAGHFILSASLPSFTPEAMVRAVDPVFEGAGKSFGGIALSPMYMASTLGGVLNGDDPLKTLKGLGRGLLDSVNVFAPGLSESDRIERAINATLMLIGAARGVGILKIFARGGGLTHVIADKLGIDPQLVGMSVNKALADSRFLNEVDSLFKKQQVVHEGTNVGPRSFREPVATGVQFRNGSLTASPEVIDGQLTVKQGIRSKSTLPQALQVGEQAARGTRVSAATNIEAPGRPTSVTGTNIKVGKPLKNMPEVSGAGKPTQTPEPTQQPPTGTNEGATGTPKPGENPGSGNVGSTPTASTTISEPAPVSQTGNLPETGKVAPEPAPKTPKASTAPEPAQVSSFWDSLDDRISKLEKKGSGGKRSTRSGATYAPDIELTALKTLRLARDTGRALHDVVEEAVSPLSEDKAAQVRALVATLPHGLEYAPPSKPAFTTEPVTLGGPANDSTVTYDSPTAPVAPKSGKPQPETQFETRPSNAGMDQVRKEVGLPETDGRSNKLPNESEQSYDAKKVEGWLKDASDAVERGVQPKGFEAWQTNHFHQYMESLKGAYNKDPSPGLAAKIDHATRAFKAVGSPTGQALAARSVGSSGYTAGDSIEHFVKNADAGSEMPKGYQEKATAMGKAWEKQKAKVDDVAAQQGAKDAERKLQEIAGKEKRATAEDEIQKIRREREKAVLRIKAKLQDFAKNGTIMSDPFMFQTAAKGVKTLAEIAPDVMAVVRSLIKEGKVRIAGIPAETARITGLKESDVHNIIAGAYEKTPKELGPKAQKVKDAIAELTEQAKQTQGAQRFAINQRIKRLQSQLDDFTYKPKPRTKVPKELERELIKLKSLESQIEDVRKEAIGLANRANPASTENVLGILRKVAGAVTGTVASTDMSYFLNQGLPGLLSHPNQSVRALGSAMKAAISEGNLHQLEGWLRAQPEYDLARASGLDIGEGAGVHDIFPAQAILEKPGTVQTPFGEVGLNPIRASERAFAANAKVLRMLTFKQMLKAYETGGMFGKLFKEGSRFGPKEADLATAKLIAEWVNTMSGVGTGEVGRMLRSANTKVPILFGPSLLVSRWKLATGTPLINALVNKDWRVAKMIGADYAKIAGAIYAGTKLAQQFGYDVETDPRSSNFLKVRVRGSEVWVDPWGNLQQPMRLMAQVTQGIKDKNGAVNTDATQRVEQVYRYFGYKTNPFLKIVLGNLTGEEQFTHKKMNLWSLEGLQTNLSSILPMSIGNMNEIWQANGLSTAEKLSLSALAFLGINVNDKGKGK